MTSKPGWRVRVCGGFLSVCVQLVLVWTLLAPPQPGSLEAATEDAHSVERLPLSYVVVESSIAASVDADSPALQDSSLTVTGITQRKFQVELAEPRAILIETSDATRDVPELAVAKTGAVTVGCEVHIHQSPRGLIEAIDFGRCSDDFVWQGRLLQSIQAAGELVALSSEGKIPPVRTFIFETDSISPDQLARQLSTTAE